MRVFVFGAGASLGSQVPERAVGTRERAPLVNDLFSEAYAGASNGLLTPKQLEQIRAEVDRAPSLEDWLTARWDAIPTKTVATIQESEKAFFGRVTFYVWQLMMQISLTYSDDNLYAEL